MKKAIVQFIKKYNWFSGSDASGLSNNSPDMYKSFSDHSRWWSFDDVKTDLINGQLSTVIRMKNESNRSQRPTKPLIAFWRITVPEETIAIINPIEKPCPANS